MEEKGGSVEEEGDGASDGAEVERALVKIAIIHLWKVAGVLHKPNGMWR